MTSSANLDHLAATRMAVYRFALETFDKPSAAQHAWMRASEYQHLLAQICERFGVACPATLGIEQAPDDHAASYIAWFEVGMPTPPVVLQASHYNRHEPSPRILHEHVLFYRTFDAALSDGNLDQPDHLLNQLAFLIHLDELMMLASREAAPIHAARRDFLRRHVVPLVRGAAAAADRHDAPAAYRAVLSVVDAVVAQDLELTETALLAPMTSSNGPLAEA